MGCPPSTVAMIGACCMLAARRVPCHLLPSRSLTSNSTGVAQAGKERAAQMMAELMPGAGALDSLVAAPQPSGPLASVPSSQQDNTSSPPTSDSSTSGAADQAPHITATNQAGRQGGDSNGAAGAMARTSEGSQPQTGSDGAASHRTSPSNYTPAQISTQQAKALRVSNTSRSLLSSPRSSGQPLGVGMARAHTPLAGMYTQGMPLLQRCLYQLEGLLAEEVGRGVAMCVEWVLLVGLCLWHMATSWPSV